MRNMFNVLITLISDHNYLFNRSPPMEVARAQGSTGFIIHKSVKFDTIPPNKPLQAYAVKIHMGRKVTLCSLYLEPSLEIFSKTSLAIQDICCSLIFNSWLISFLQPTSSWVISMLNIICGEEMCVTDGAILLRSLLTIMI